MDHQGFRRLTGTLNQEPRPMPIVRKLLLAAVATFALAAAAQAPNPTPAHLRRRLGQAEQDRRRATQQRSPRYRKRLLRDRSKRRPYLRRRLLRGDQPAALAIHRLRIQALRHAGTGPPLQLLRRTQVQGTRLGHRWLRRLQRIDSTSRPALPRTPPSTRCAS